MKTAYLVHILLWMPPVLILQWWIGFRILRSNLRPILFSTLIASLYLGFADSIAIREGIWFFDPRQTLGITLGPWLPVEEFLFFAITSLLVSQSLILLLPEGRRWK